MVEREKLQGYENEINGKKEIKKKFWRAVNITDDVTTPFRLTADFHWMSLGISLTKRASIPYHNSDVSWDKALMEREQPDWPLVRGKGMWL
ncbi:hypothetical protein TNCV_3558311 [Trichonephila clavipes]|uniref:Uncharacterized protein n=1 Tax=Trichonephila clavipes TaxID=2585209 RepID=A0A8X6WCD8_TRICX|nr:hypothetical protein TNCV_3558311 [Trichonephila clavipes]